MASAARGEITMKKTTVYLPDALKASLERMAEAEGRSEAEIIRESIERSIARQRRPRPRLPLTTAGLGDPGAAERADELLERFGS
jgi:hypothetical protein